MLPGDDHYTLHEIVMDEYGAHIEKLGKLIKKFTCAVSSITDLTRHHQTLQQSPCGNKPVPKYLEYWAAANHSYTAIASIPLLREL